MRAPAWLIEVADTFDVEDKDWFQNALIPIINKRNKMREEMWGKKSITKNTYKNLLNHLKVYLFRKYSSLLFSTEYVRWIDSLSLKQLTPYDEKLVHFLKNVKTPSDLLKLQVEIRGKLKKNPKFKTEVGRQFLAVELMKPSIRKVMDEASQKKKLEPKKSASI